MASRNSNKASPAVLAPVINKPTDQIKRQLSDVDAAEALLHMSKRPRVIAEEICSTKEDCRPSKDREEEEGTGVGVQQANCRIALLQAENRVYTKGGDWQAAGSRVRAGAAEEEPGVGES